GLARRGPRGGRRSAGLGSGPLMGRILISGTAALLICVFLSPKFISFLRVREFGQHIREEGPEGHHSKAGTPTMGGIIIFTAISAPFLILSNYDWRGIGIYLAAIACAALGFADDYTKIVKRRSLGLRARTKLGVTMAISVGLWWVAHHKAGLPDTLRLRFVDAQIDLGIFYPVLIYLVVAGTTSAVNLTDGLDVMTKTEVLLILLGGIFVVEALSVVIQVFSFQAFRKRVFLMAPIHHHFELMAWSETKIILRFWILASVCSAIGFTIYQASITG